MNEGMNLVHRLLDEQVVDVDGRRCGRVDDIELELDPPRVSALLLGDGLYPRRVPRRMRPLVRLFVGELNWGANAVRVPWEQVDRIDATVRLKGKAEELGLGMGDDPGRWIARRLPWN